MAIAAVALASLLMAASVGCGTKVEAPANPSPTATKSAETSPSPSASAIDTEPTEASFEIPASMINDPKALVETFLSRYNLATSAGANHENAYAAMMSSTENIDEYAARVASKYDKDFNDALLVKDWESNPRLGEFNDNSTLVHRLDLALFILTSFPDVEPADKQPYMQVAKIDKILSVTDQTDKSVTVAVMLHAYDNADLNRAGALTDGVTANGISHKVTFTFIVEGDQIKLSDYINPPYITAE